MRRRAILPAVALGLVAVCALSALTVYGTYHAIQSSDLRIRAGGATLKLFGQARASAVVTETRRFATSPGAELRVHVPTGSVDVSVIDGRDILMEAHKRAWAGDEASARKAAGAIDLDISASSDRVAIDHRAPEDLLSTVPAGRGSEEVDLRLRVPADVVLNLETDFGDIAVQAALGIDVEARPGGAVLLASRTGAVALGGWSTKDAVSLTSRFGRVHAEGVTARSLVLESTNGAIDATDVRLSEPLRANTDFGTIDLTDVSGPAVSVTTANGDVDLRRLRVTRRVDATSRFGKVQVSDSTAPIHHLDSSNGAVSLTGAAGRIEASSDFGVVELGDIEQAILDVRSGNGGVRFAGSLNPGSDHAVNSTFGDVTIRIPETSRLALDLKTNFGSIETELPVLTKSPTDAHHLVGELNGGGSVLRVVAQNGSVLVAPLQ